MRKFKYILQILVSRSFFIVYFATFPLYASPMLDKLSIPEGFEITIFADELNTPRQISETENGYIIA